MKHPRADIEALLTSIAHTKYPTIDLSLDRIRKLLTTLGNPEKRLPPVVHVAGTNGKGSLLAYLRAILEAAGYRVHRYTSPHLVLFNERIMLAGKDIDDDYLFALLTRVARECETQPVTYFEATTAVAFLAFAEVKADIVLLETGMGGRLDATNVPESPLLTAITPVSMDHMDYLGSTLSAIAGEKAGILKQGITCVLGPQSAEGLEVIERAANKLKAALFRHGNEWSAVWEGEGLRFISAAKSGVYPMPNLAGEHQIINAGTAIACVSQMKGFDISDAHIAHGITHAEWPARLQKLENGALAALVPAGSELWLDGGHNEGAALEIARWMQKQTKPVHMICGMLQTKEPEAFFAPLTPYIVSVAGVEIEEEPLSRPAQEICNAARNSGIENLFTGNIKDSIKHIVKNNNNDFIIIICGSLLLAGNTLWQNNTGA